ncbi:helicase-associated domain-containing protein [Brachybacterium huguangmaarense]
MSEPFRSLAEALRSFDDERLAQLLAARPDLAAPVPRGIGPLAARAAGSASVHRALSALRRPELSLLEALVVLPEPADPAALAAAVGSDPAEAAPFLERLRTLALAWGETEIRAVRGAHDVLRTPAGLAPEHDDDPSPDEASRRIGVAPGALAPVLERLAWGPARIDADPASPAARALLDAGIAERRGDALVIPRTVHLALRGGRVRDGLAAHRPAPSGPAITERIPGARDAQAVEAAFDALRICGTVRRWDDDPPSVLRRGGMAQRDLRRLAQQADAPVPAYAAVIQTAWLAGLLGHDGEAWQPTADWDAFRARPLEERWAELALAWAQGRHVAALAGTPDAAGAPRALLGEATFRDGARTRRLNLLRALHGAPGIAASVDSLVASLTWAFPLVPAATAVEEARALLVEGQALGLVLDGALTALGEALLAELDAADGAGTAVGADRDVDPREADAHLARRLRELAPPAVDEVLLDSDLTATIPGRPAERLLPLLDWTEPVSRGGALTLRFTAASVRRAMSRGADADDLRALLAATSRSPVPQALDYLLRDEARRHGQVHIGRAASFLTAEEDVLALFASSPHAAPLALTMLAPTVAVSTAEPGFVLQMVRRAELSGIAVGPDGSTARDDRGHTLRGGGAEVHLERADGPELRLAPAEAVARIREAEAGAGEDPSVTDRLLDAIAHGRTLRLGIVDGRGGVIARDAVPLSLEGGRLRARDARGAEEFTVLVHRVTLG